MKRWRQSCVIALVLLVLVAWRWGSEKQADESAAPRAPTHDDVTPVAAPPGNVQRFGPRAVAPAPDTVGTPSAPTRRDTALADYRESAVYPPSSRPLRTTDAGLIDWNARHERPRASRVDPRVTVLLTADRYWVTGEEQLEVRFSATPQVAGLELIAESEETAVALASETTDDGGTTTVIAPLAASDLQLTAPTRVRITARYQTPNGAHDERWIHVVFTPVPPALFTGRFREATVAGSLVVYAEIEVRQAGRYVIDANLWDDDDAPVAWSRFKGELPTGRSEVALTFFGKILHDHLAAHGPSHLHVGQLRGAQHRLGEEPDLAPVEPWAAGYATRRYRADDFSAAEYDSPHKRAKLAKLAELEDRGGVPTIARAGVDETPPVR